MLYMKYWGKTQPDGSWRPVAGHIAAATRAGVELLSYWTLFIKRVQDLSDWSEDETRRALLYATAMHDIGKFHVYFQWKNEARFEQTYGDKSNLKLVADLYYKKRFYHGTHGMMWFLRHHLGDMTGELFWENTPLLAASAHHGQFAGDGDWGNVNTNSLDLPKHIPAEIAQDNAAMREYADEVAALFPPPPPISKRPGEGKRALLFRRNNVTALIAFFVSVADWLGSDDHHFPLQKSWPDMTFTDFYSDPSLQEEARKVVLESGLQGFNHDPDRDYSLVDLQGRTLTGVQEYVQGIFDACLTIIEAPTGDGKTEAALLLVMNYLMRGMVNRMVNALPTKATANAMYDRVDRQIRHTFGMESAVAHGDANAVRYAHRQSFILKVMEEAEQPSQDMDEDPDASESILEDPEDEDSCVFMTKWLSSGKRALLNNFVTCTIDQVLMSALKNNKHWAVRQGALSTSVIVLDEVHAADLYMNGILTAALEMWAQQGARVILLSATLSEKQRGELIEAFWKGRGLKGTPPALTVQGYPLVTTLSDAGIVTQKALAPKRAARTLKVEIIEHGWVLGKNMPAVPMGDVWNLAEDLIRSVEAGACTCCILNSVGSAQELYAIVKEIRPNWKQGCERFLLHAGLSKSARRKIEPLLKDRFGPKGSELGIRTPSLVIGTQILEQSLDLDFDRMVRQLCPMDGIIQAMGRCHRHVGLHVRPAGFEEAVLEVFMPTSTQAWPGGNTLYTLVYKEKILAVLRTWEDLKTRTQFTEPTDVPGLINRIFDTQVSPAEGVVLEHARQLDLNSEIRMGVECSNAALNLHDDEIKDTDASLRKYPTRFGISTRPFLFLIPLGMPGRYRVAHTSEEIDLSPFMDKGLETPIKAVGEIDADFERRKRKHRKVQRAFIQPDWNSEVKNPNWPRWGAVTRVVLNHCANRSKVTLMNAVEVEGPTKTDAGVQLLQDLWVALGMYPRGLTLVLLETDTDHALIQRITFNDNGGTTSKEYETWYDPDSGLWFKDV